MALDQLYSTDYKFEIDLRSRFEIFIESSRNKELAVCLVKCFENFDFLLCLQELNSYCSNNGLVSEKEFISWISSITSDDHSVTAAKHLFNLFNSHPSNLIDFTELSCGLLCLFSGSKSIKLSIAFSLLDESNNGKLSRRQLWKMFRSFLRTISMFSTLSLSPESSSILTTAKIFTYFSQPQTITLEDLSDWYIFCGNDISFWIELIDPMKWK